jgi:oligopeptide/dipeptide ABC transporter, ATP-binding protein, C-terminal domain
MLEVFKGGGGSMSTPLLEIKGLKKHFVVRKNSHQRRNLLLKAVDGINLTIHDGETVGLVGESGCGKTTFGRSVLKLHSITEGQILYRGTDITNLSVKEMRPYRKKMQIIFQDPYAALNPRKTVYQSVKVPLDVEGRLSEEEKYKRVLQRLNQVGMSEKDLRKYPHEMSGGQRQRVVIARALISNPDFIVCDEPVSALDVSVRSQVLNLIKDIQQKEHLAYLFISHDLSVVRYLCDRVAVMYLGKIVEIADNEQLFKRAMHPYTKALLSAIPVADIHRVKDEIILEGEVPSPVSPPSGCRFCTRCQFAEERCFGEEPELEKVDDSQSVACFRWRELMETCAEKER